MRFFNFSSFVSRKLKYLFIKLPSVYLAPVYDLISVILYPNNNLHSMPICCCLPAVDWPSQETRGLLVFQTYFFLYFPLDNQDQLRQPKQDQPLFPEMASCTYPLKEISLLDAKSSKAAEPKLQQQEGKFYKWVICYYIDAVGRDAITKSLTLVVRPNVFWLQDKYVGQVVQSKYHIYKTALLTGIISQILL